MRLFGRRRHTALILLICTAAFLTVGLLASKAVSKGYEVLLFDKLVLESVSYLLFTASIAVFIVLVFYLIFKKGKFLLLLFVIPILLEFLVLAVAFFLISLPTETETQRYTFEEFDHDIVIENRSFLLIGRSTVYEARGIIVKRVANVTGDDGWCPLEKDEYFSITIRGDQLVFDYFFVGPEIGERQLVLEYVNRHFIEIPQKAQP